jgi:hypothetical protein
MFFVSLDKQSRFPQGPIDQFLWRYESQRHVWKGQGCRTAKELADALNEALPVFKRLDNPFLNIEVTEEPDAVPAPVYPDVQAYDPPPAEKAKRLATKASAQPALAGV